MTDPLLQSFVGRLKHIANYDPERGLADMPLVTHEDQAHWIDESITHNPGRIGLLLDIPAKTMELLILEIPPGKTSDLQRHTHESVHCVVEGEGYSEIGPQTLQWRAGSFIYTPVWVWHRHYNTGNVPAKLITVENSRMLEAMSLARRESAGLVTYAEHMQRLASESPGEAGHEASR
jgi:mannose-6-phosphate isomerase-like protein (cupin superfamily)